MLPLGELVLPIGREELVVPLVAPEPVVLPVVPWLPVLPLPEDMLLPADEPPVPVWLWTKAGTVNAAILTARNACHRLLFFIVSYSFLVQSLKSRLLM